MGGLNSMKEWEDAGLAKEDKVHFTNEGYRLLGDLLYNAFIDRYIEHIKSTAKRP
jgi:lysophospholipase L1-like esterase